MANTNREQWEAKKDWLRKAKDHVITIGLILGEHREMWLTPSGPAKLSIERYTHEGEGVTSYVVKNETGSEEVLLVAVYDDRVDVLTYVPGSWEARLGRWLDRVLHNRPEKNNVAA